MRWSCLWKMVIVWNESPCSRIGGDTSGFSIAVGGIEGVGGEDRHENMASNMTACAALRCSPVFAVMERSIERVRGRVGRWD